MRGLDALEDLLVERCLPALHDSDEDDNGRTMVIGRDDEDLSSPVVEVVRDSWSSFERGVHRVPKAGPLDIIQDWLVHEDDGVFANGPLCSPKVVMDAVQVHVLVERRVPLMVEGLNQLHDGRRTHGDRRLAGGDHGSLRDLEGEVGPDELALVLCFQGEDVLQNNSQ